MTQLEAITILVENTNESNLELLELHEAIEINHSLLLEIHEVFKHNIETMCFKFNDIEQNFFNVINNSLNSAVNLQEKTFIHGVSLQKNQLERTKTAMEIYKYSLNNFQ